jgi:hypothetical protein
MLFEMFLLTPEHGFSIYCQYEFHRIEMQEPRGVRLMALSIYLLLPPFLFISRWLVQFCTSPRLIKRNGGSIYYGAQEFYEHEKSDGLETP